MNKVFPRILLLLFALVSLSGCETAAYYAQAINGHAQLLYHTESIDARLRDAATAPRTRERLEKVLAMRDFASTVLALPDNESYRSYADLRREAVVWSLVATPEFSVSPLEWCYPVIGCAAYRAYFSENDARAHAERLSTQGRDVMVGAVPAYSTLGWFADPLPSTVIDWPEPRLAGLIFHELAHQRLYVADESAFNESFASAVEQAGVRLWLETHAAGEVQADWQARYGREREFVALLMETRSTLEQLYVRRLPPEQMRRRKQSAFSELQNHYRKLKSSWRGGEAFDTWFAQPVNNARLASIGTYEQWVPAFLELLSRHNGDFSAFYREAEALSKLPADERRLVLQQLDVAAKAPAP